MCWYEFGTHSDIRTVALFSVGELRWDLHQSSLVDTHSHESFVHPFNQLLLANKDIVRAATVITKTCTKTDCQVIIYEDVAV